MANDFFGIDSKLAFSKFFDRDAVIRKVDKKTAAAMKHVGGTTRKIARRSIRKPTGTTLHSPPGKPVRSATGIIKRTIFFEYDDRKQVMIAGPKKLSIRSKIKPRGGKTVPEILEFGGTAKATEPVYKRVRNRNNRGKSATKKRNKFRWVRLPDTPFRYKPRPTMQLAKKKTFTQPKLQYAFGVLGFNTRT